PAARFSVRLERKSAVDGKAVIGPYGLDEPEFYVSFNRGEGLKPLSMVASGGELSRLMLALKSVLAKADGVPTMIFDEVDTGIGGEVAIGVGLHLAALATSKQVLCITHLASIAARADTHYKVEKRAEGERTVTCVYALDRAQSVKELARMLSGDPDGQASLAHAEDLLQKLGSTRGS
ncbi:MAG TPA: DNA repair protein RecN, partial [Spirochaetales bacterium]|nr:DNA repair protein RecN [Spirochaetales bacterium]